MVTVWCVLSVVGGLLSAGLLGLLISLLLAALIGVLWWLPSTSSAMKAKQVANAQPRMY